MSKYNMLLLGTYRVPLIDDYGRPLLHLRISVTNSCNYQCLYCHSEGIEHIEGYLTPKEIGIIAQVALDLGINRFKITGGEPLLRKDIVSIVRELAMTNPVDLGMTTNGYYLVNLAEELAKAGLKRVNISLPSLKPNTYKYITGVDGLERVLKGIRESIDVGFKPIKINYVLLKGVNDSEFWDFVEFTRSLGIILQVIELEPIGIGMDIFSKYYIPTSQFERIVSSRCIRRLIRQNLHARPIYILENGAVIEFVKWFCNPDFCAHCTRIRLTPDGKLKTCICSGYEIDLKPALRPRINTELIKELIVRANKLRRPYNRYRL